MSKALFVTGTGTDTGKTYITGLIVKKLQEAKKNPPIINICPEYYPDDPVVYLKYQWFSVLFLSGVYSAFAK